MRRFLKAEMPANDNARLNRLEAQRRFGKATDKSPEELEREYLQPAGEAAPKKRAAKREKTADELEREYMGEAYVPERKRAKAPPTPSERRSAVVRDKEGRVTALRADQTHVTTKEAYQYISGTYQRINEDLADLESSGLPESEKNRRRRALEAEADKLEAFQKEVDRAFETPEARDARYEGGEVLVENPMYQEEAEPLRDEEIIESRPDVQKAWNELKAMYAKKYELMDQRDTVMKRLKGEAIVGGWKIDVEKAEAARTKEEVHWPDYFPRDLEKAKRHDEAKKRAEAAEKELAATKREMGFSEQLHHILTELDDVNEEILKKERDVQFLEKKYGKAAPGDRREAA